MAGVKISALPAIVAPALTDVFPVVQSGVTFKETGTQLSTLFTSVFLPLAGGTMTGSIVMGANAIRFNSGYGLVDQNGMAVIAVVPAATAVNYFTFTNSATGNAVSATAAGTDTNIIYNIAGKGTGNVQIKGTGTNNNASTGYVGEYISSTVLVGAAVACTTTVAVDVTSISLTAGDWDVTGVVASSPAAGTTTQSIQGWISTTAATIPTVPNEGAIAGVGAYTASMAAQVPVGQKRISLAATTTVYLGISATFAVSTMAAYGFIGARRVR